jgi:hypothetical protein
MLSKLNTGGLIDTSCHLFSAVNYALHVRRGLVRDYVYCSPMWPWMRQAAKNPRPSFPKQASENYGPPNKKMDCPASHPARQSLYNPERGITSFRPYRPFLPLEEHRHLVFLQEYQRQNIQLSKEDRQ